MMSLRLELDMGDSAAAIVKKLRDESKVAASLIVSFVVLALPPPPVDADSG